MVSGSTNETKDRIVHTIRNADTPVLSASDIAERADFSKRTVNNHIGDLVEDGRVQSTKVGNATAYYVAQEDYPRHQLPDHRCKRCNRKIYDIYDLTRVATTLEYGDDKTTFRYILCHFCEADLTAWINGDDGSMYEYPRVHTWDIPDEQLEEVRNDEEIETMTDRPGMFDEIVWEVYDAVLQLGGDSLDDGVTQDQIHAQLGDEYSDYQIRDAIETAERAALLRKDSLREEYVAAK